jgi:hypothetical protein
MKVAANRTPQLRASEIARMHGFTSRYWTRMAAAGRIPGARQPSGIGGAWVFDARQFAAWWESRTKRVEAWPGYTVEGKAGFGGVAPSVRTENTGEASRQRIERLRNVVFGNSSPSLMRSHGGISRIAPSRKHPNDLPEST